jgi:hypothetical protein
VGGLLEPEYETSLGNRGRQRNNERKKKGKKEGKKDAFMWLCLSIHKKGKKKRDAYPTRTIECWRIRFKGENLTGMAYTCNSSILEAKARRIMRLKSAWAAQQDPASEKQKQTTTRHWWLMPVILATWEAEISRIIV